MTKTKTSKTIYVYMHTQIYHNIVNRYMSRGGEGGGGVKATGVTRVYTTCIDIIEREREREKRGRERERAAERES